MCSNYWPFKIFECNRALKLWFFDTRFVDDHDRDPFHLYFGKDIMEAVNCWRLHTKYFCLSRFWRTRYWTEDWRLLFSQVNSTSHLIVDCQIEEYEWCYWQDAVGDEVEYDEVYLHSHGVTVYAKHTLASVTAPSDTEGGPSWEWGQWRRWSPPPPRPP